jgi:hypothetical protein
MSSCPSKILEDQFSATTNPPDVYDVKQWLESKYYNVAG